MGKWDFIIEPLLRDLKVGDRRRARSDQIPTSTTKFAKPNRSFPRLDREISTRDRKTALPHFCASYAGLCDSV